MHYASPRQIDVFVQTVACGSLRAVAELLHMADVSFAVLGTGESCTGDPARRAGNSSKHSPPPRGHCSNSSPPTSRSTCPWRSTSTKRPR